MMKMVLLLSMEIPSREMPNGEVKSSGRFLSLIFENLFLVSMAPHKPGSVSGSLGKSKLIRRSSVKLRKPSLRIKESAKSK